jgi:uncharacterized membrane protein YdcZ (DUF606 family)
MKTKNVYVVMCLKKSHPVEIPQTGIESDLQLNWADGMCGVMPVFTNKKLARRYAGKRFDILKAQIYQPETDEENPDNGKE